MFVTLTVIVAIILTQLKAADQQLMTRAKEAAWYIMFSCPYFSWRIT